MSDVNENNESVNEVEAVDTEKVETTDAGVDKDVAGSEDTVSTDVDENNSDADEDEEDKDWKAEYLKWKAMSRKNESSSKENYRRVQELETEVEGLKNSAPEVENLKQENLSLLKRIVISEYNLPENAANRLVGASEEELRADAEELSKLVGGVQKGMKPVKLHGSSSEIPGEVKVGSREEWRALQKNK